MLKVSEFNYLQKGIVIILLSLFSLSILQAQQNIPLENQNKVKLIQFAKGRSAEWMTNKRKADSLAQTLNIPTIYFEKDSNRVVILQRLGQKHKPVYYATDNVSTAATISVDDVWASNNEYPSLTGKGVEINLWDGGSARATHQELQNGPGSRIIMRDLELPLSNHSTHIAGTMIASGINADAKGMAGTAIIKAWDLNDDIAEMSSAAADGIVLSNHSYGPLCGWSYNSNNESWYWYGDPEISATEDYEFGFYNQVSADWDYIAELAPYYLIVKSAGNDRNDAPDSSLIHFVWDETWKLVDVEREPDGGTDGYDCLTPMAVAKNILTVGAVDDAKTITPFSAFGPTDDGRIKPDVVANGYDVFSSTSAKDNSYTSYSGTSMSTASVSGSVALLHQLKNILQPGAQWLSSTIKGLLIHTASDLGNTGPDYRFGWGLVNIKNACDLIYANSNNQGKNIYQKVLTQGEEIIIPISTSNSFPVLKVTLVWTDPAGQPSTPSLNSRNSKLVNDLNVLVQNSNTLNEYLPWTLNVESPGTAATKNINHVDNVEQVYIANPGTNNFNIKISHSGTLSGSSQSFSLIVSGIETTPNIFPPQNLTYTINERSIGLNWNPPVSGTPDSYRIYRNGTLLKETTDLFFTDESVVFDNIYQYYVTAIYVINDEKIESLPTNEITVFPKTLRSLPFIVDFESDPSEITIGNNLLKWQWGDSESLNCYYLNFSDNTTKFIGIDSYSAGDALHVFDIAYTSPLRLADYGNINLSFDYLLKTGIYDAIDELHVVYKLQEENEWHELKKLESAFNWVHHTFELPKEMCKNGTQIGFYYDDFYQWGMGAGFDNVKLEGETSARNIDLAILSMDSPVPSCLLSENETVSITIKNVGENPALSGYTITIQMNCSTGESFTNLLVLTETLNTNDIITFEIGSVDLSKAGKYTFEFEILCSLDTNLANNELAKEIEVFAAPQPDILNQDLEFCADEPKVLIQVSPAGGTLSGVGIDGLYFNPQLAGVGSHTITYAITDVNGCEATILNEFVVNALPQPEILNQDLEFREDEQKVFIEVIPLGGVLSGPGIEGMYFNPQVAGIGNHTITYSFTDDDNCSGNTSAEIVVYSLTQPAILNTDLSFCEDEQKVFIEVMPSGGELSGPGIEGMYFDPQIAGIGTHNITYSITDNYGNRATISKEFVVNPLPQPFFLNDELSFCQNEDRFLLEVSPDGGVLSGAGIDGLYFDPAVAEEGIHTISYSINDENKCESTTFTKIVVFEKMEIDLGPDLVISIEDTIQIIPETFGCDLLWCDGSSNEKYTIIAKELGVGIHTIWVKATSFELCNSIDSLKVTVDISNAIIEDICSPKTYIYPNPVKKGFYLQLDENEIIETIYLYDQTGVIHLNKIPSTLPYFDVSQMSAGVYLLKIHTNKQQVILQIVKL